MISKKYFNPNKKSICYCMTPELIENYDLAIADKKMYGFVIIEKKNSTPQKN